MIKFWRNGLLPPVPKEQVLLKKVNLKSISQKAGSTAYLLIVLGLVGIAFLNFNPQIDFFGQFKLKALVVKSGSMEPAIKTGSLVLSKSMESYQPGDVITFKNPAVPKELITHRLVRFENKNGQELIITKGDANENEDSLGLRPDYVVGEVFFILPFLGYLIHFTRQPAGIITLIATPALLIVLIEILKIKDEIVKNKGSAEKVQKGLKTLTTILIFLIPFSAFLVTDSQAYLFDYEKATATVSVSTWEKPKCTCRFKGKKKFLFMLRRLRQKFRKIHYRLTYLSEGTLKGVYGEGDLQNDQFDKEIFLGTCSTAECFVDPDISEIQLDLLLTGPDGETLIMDDPCSEISEIEE